MKRYCGIIPGLSALAIYYSTTCRSIWIGDSGEFILALNCLGIAHPPGYPLFTLMGRIFTMAMPFLRPAFAANLFNVVIGATAIVVVYYLFSRDLSRWSATILSVLFAFSPLFWAETAGVEIYTLNLLLISITLYVIESGYHFKWLLAIYLFGLSITNHPSALSILPAFIYLFIKERQYCRWKLFLLYVFLFLIAISVYLYLPIRSACNPISNWGNPDNIRSLIGHMTLKQYSGWVSYSWENLLLSFRLFFMSILKSWWWIGVIASIVGIITGWSKNRSRTINALLILLTSLILSSAHQALNYEPFFITTLFAALLLMGNNFYWLESRSISKIVRYGIYAVGFIACIILILYYYKEMDKSNYKLSEDYSRLILDTAGSGVLFTAGDINSFTTLYLSYVEKYKPGVEVYDRSIRLSSLLQKAFQMTGCKISDYYTARSAVINNFKGNKFLSKNHYTYEPNWLNLVEPIYSYGILYAVTEKPEGTASMLKYPANYDPGDVLSRQLLVNIDLARGEQELCEVPPDTTTALQSFNLALNRLRKEPRATTLNALGIFFRRTGFLELAIKSYKEALERPIIWPSLHHDILFNISNVYKDYGNTYLDAHDFHKAVSSYIKALKFDQDNPKLLLNIGLIYIQVLNDTTNAIIYLEKYIEKNPSDTPVRNLINKLD